MSVGMLFSYVLYRELLVSRITGLLSRYVEARSAGIHLDRLSDIVFAAPEPVPSTSAIPDFDSAVRIEFHDIWFRFSENDPWILRGVSGALEGQESVVIAGRSGCGKSTLLKILQGLLTPTRGLVTVNGIPISESLASYRRFVSAVNQDDDLFVGTIAENISFFDAPADIRLVKASAQRACIASDIEAMPMGYNTLITDTGLSFSGGQKQRLLLARALYRKSRVLFLDEATSHLDLDTERQIISWLNQLPLLRIIVAHRPETIAACSPVLYLNENGVIT